ncbi:MAG: MFS transporter [Pyrinomonadaceae bacterium]|nr:MFS transporter [Pyrinomonadaceae bacterium]
MGDPKPTTTIDSPAAESPALRDSPQRWWLLALLFSAMLISYVHRGAFSVAAPFMSKDLHLSKAGIGIILSAFFWVYSFMQMPAGWIVDRFGVRRAYSLGFIFWSLASTVTGFARGFASLIGMRVALGVGQAITFPASARAVANSFPQSERGTVTGIYLTGVRVGAALINAVGAALLARYDWKLFFIVTGLIPLVWLLPWNKFLGKWESQAAVTSASTPLKNQTSFRDSLLLLKNRTVLGIFLGFFAYDYVWFVFITWLPGYLVLERQFTPNEMAVYSSVPYLPMSVIIILSGVSSDWLVRRGYDEKLVRKIFIITGLAIGCLIVPAGMVSDKLTAVWLLTISLCGLGICSPNTWTLTQAVCEKKIVGTVTGIQNFGGNLGGILAPALTGYIAHVTDSFALAFLVAGLVLVVGMFAYWFLISDTVEV